MGYYRQDGVHSDPKYDCDVNFYAGSTQGAYAHQARCDGYYASPATDGTNDQDIRNLACQLAWWIYGEYTVWYRPVRIVAHSMGGLTGSHATPTPTTPSPRSTVDRRRRRSSTRPR